MCFVLTRPRDSDLYLLSALYLMKDRGQITSIAEHKNTDRNTTERTYLFDERIGIIRAAD